jgi:hypothetical protein
MRINITAVTGHLQMKVRVDNPAGADHVADHLPNRLTLRQCSEPRNFRSPEIY